MSAKSVEHGGGDLDARAPDLGDRDRRLGETEYDLETGNGVVES